MIKNRIQAYLKEKSGFALWSNPGSTEISILFDEGEGDKKFILAPFDLENQEILEFSGSNIHRVPLNDLNRIAVSLTDKHASESYDKEVYAEDFKCFVQELKSDSTTEKLVLARSIQNQFLRG